jgi:hypothetical protein
MASLTSSTIASTYDRLLALPSGGGDGATLVGLTDGDGTTTFCISLTDASTGKAVLAVDGSHASGTEVQIDNSAADGDAFLSFQLSGTSKFTMGVDDGDSDKFKIGTTAIGTGTMFALDTNSRISLSNNDNNSYNTVLGYTAFNAGSDNGSDYNTIIGHNSAGTGSVSGATYNVGLGYNSLTDLDSANYNVALGSNSAGNLTTGGSNVAIGQGALFTPTTAGANVAIGQEAMADIQAGQAITGVVAVGFEAIKGSGSTDTGINYSVAVGYHALNALTTGGGNTAVGYQAGDDLTDGSNNVFIGYQAADAVRTGSIKNVVIGSQAFGGTHVTSSTDSCIAIGYLALSGALNNVDGTVAIGESALAALTTGAGNLAVGHSTLASITSGAGNTAVGYNAMGDATGGSTAATSGQNTAIGHASMGGDWADAATLRNTAVGTYTMNQILNAALDNTVVGYSAGNLITSGGSNVCLGAYAGNTILTGSDNTYVGKSVVASANSVTNETAIGHDAVGQGTDTVTLGDGDVTDVYMADDSGATVHCAGAVVTEGINFPDDASANPSADVNTLDSYEEGSWTPAVKFGGNSDSLTYSAQGGYYTKIGRQVTATFNFTMNNNGSSTGNATIEGLPFTVANNNGAYNGLAIGHQANWSSSGTIRGYAGINETVIYLVEFADDGTTTNIDEGDTANNSGMLGTITYFV